MNINFFDHIQRNRLFSHVAFWLFVLLIAPITSENTEGLFSAFLFRLVGMPIKIIATYFLVYYLIPQYIYRRRYVMFLLLFLFSSYVFTVIYRINNVYIAEYIMGYDERESFLHIATSFKWTFLAYLGRVYSFTILFLVIKGIRDQSKKQARIDRLEKEKTQAELRFLKAQIHPHFLFNTLNNLYVLTLRKSDKAPDVVEKLSAMMDYILYHCDDKEVKLSDEIRLIENYIELEKLRYGDRLKVDFNHNVDQGDYRIAPLILISLVENAFKHGVSSTLVNPEVKIGLNVQQGQLVLHVFNTKSPISQKDQTKYKEGIGLNNVKSQLALEYQDRHEWKINEKEQTYEVQLNIRL